MSDSYPTFPVAAPVSDGEIKTDYRKINSYHFDVLKGDFVLDKRGIVTRATAQELFINWCMKAIHTPRRSKFSYTNNYGSELEEAFKEPTRAAKELAIRRAITEAIMADPYQRALSATEFSFNWDTDSVEVTCLVLAVDDLTARLKTTLPI